MTRKRKAPDKAPDVSDILKEPSKSDPQIFLEAVKDVIKDEQKHENTRGNAKLENGEWADEIGLSDSWLEANPSDYLYNSDTNLWLNFHDGLWSVNVHAAERSMADVIERQCSSSGLRRKLANHKTIRGSLAIASASVLAYSDEFNANTELLGMPGGSVLDLDSMIERPADPEDMLTMQTAVKPVLTRSPKKWFAFLDEAMQGDKQMIKFLQASCKYWLTGEIREPYVWILTGISGTGKSVFTNTVSNVLGDYAVTLSERAFIGRDEHSTVIAAIEHKRMALSSEVKGKLKSGLVKSISGGDRISARRMRQDAREFQPACSLVFTCNGLPSVDVDSAMRRRLLIVPFDHKPDDEDVNVNLMHDLKDEYGGILEWMIEGGEINIPSAVRSLSDEFMDAQDMVKLFVGERCKTEHKHDEHDDVTVADLFAAYSKFCESKHKGAGSKISFGKEVANLLPRVEKTTDYRNGKTVRVWQGISLLPPPPAKT